MGSVKIPKDVIDMYNILICDDDKDIVSALEIYLTSEGYKTVSAYNGEQAIQAVNEGNIDLILMDIMMPQMDGIRATARLRESGGNIPIILLTAKSEDTDKVLGLSMGADDYVSKPYNPQELAARVKSQLRRYTMLGGIHAQHEEDEIVNGRLCYRLQERTLYADGEPVKLTATETKIMELLMKNRGRIFPAEEIYERVWEEPSFAPENTVMVHIRHIREKIELNPKEPEYIKVVWGIGYKMEKK